jgi:hypothetical protein
VRLTHGDEAVVMRRSHRLMSGLRAQLVCLWREVHMQVSGSSFTVAEYCEQMRNGGIVVNHDYQRTDKVWPPAARSYLIETILMGYPVPKMALNQTTDLKTKRTKKEIVDGQQRSQAISDFLDDKFKLSSKSEFGGNIFSQLEPEQQQKFVEYILTVDLFVGATPEDIRQVFRRINSYTVPLNPQEKRHAIHQGELKWTIVELTEVYAGALKSLGVFKEKQLSRMADAALIADVLYTFALGIRSASETNLNRFYEDNDKVFINGGQLMGRLRSAMDVVFSWPDIHQTSLMKPYNFFTLILAISHALNPISTLNESYARDHPQPIDPQFALPNLTALASALDEPSSFPTLAKYVLACSKATNRIEQRKARFQFQSEALNSTLIA